MTLIYIITALGATALVKGSGVMECNLSQPTDNQQCFGKLGEPLTFHLPPLTFHLPTKTTQTSFKRGHDIIFKYPCDKSLEINGKCGKFSTIYKNGTFLVGKTTREISGNYQMETHSDNDAPVSEPIVSQTCLSAEQMTVSCSAEGDEAEFTLSLDSNELIRTRSGKAEDPSVTISLHGQLVGNLVCNVQNNVSKQQTVFNLTSCTGASSHCLLPVAAVKITAVILLLFCWTVFLIIKHFNKKANYKTAVRQGDVEEEIVNSDVRVTRGAR
ncbi:uncharacterized protein LOC121654710 isoform X2 [Melanotaenia boesemani]|uniref:uncharacterized protein LOC121654710 isoform X2 n=1 Tax=Melanotaenia boesemani TaxID=1250792 RepID=UPI001C052C78|nr:uncharacterized protein LOC121654710 isoform X2 [Melanotaenia boesemani]